MDYETPAIEVLGPASQLVQAYLGPQTDGGGWNFSQGGVTSTVLDED